MRNIISLDVEDYVSSDRWRRAPDTGPISPRVEEETRRALDLFDEMGVTATCFVLGRVAVAMPQLVREILARGHEVASHGHAHLRMRYLTPRTFREDLRASLTALEDATGQPVYGFRAPGFSLSEEYAWAFPIMAEFGLTFDTSLTVVWPGGLAAGRRLIEMAAAAGIREIPGFHLGAGRLSLPLGGGATLGILPAALTAWGIRVVNRAGFPVPLYFHPYDLFPRHDDPWHRDTWVGRTSMRLFLAMQSAGRRRLAPHLRSAAAVSGVGTIGEYLSYRKTELVTGSVAP